MSILSTLKESLSEGKFDRSLSLLYTDLPAKKDRILSLLDDFANLYGENREIRFFSAPGRSEVGGNHTDHNHGKVLAASINLDALAAVSPNDEGIIRVKSRGYDKTDVIDLSNLEPRDEELGHSAALIRGTAARFVEMGYKVGGFDAATVSDVLSGSGLSSSAAFEVLIGTILNHLYNDGKISPIEIAQIAQYAENEFFGKPCGLLDQMACSVGGFVRIDFKNPDSPVITPLSFDFSTCGHSLCILDTRASHADLTDEYAAIRREMESVAAFFGKSCLREVDENEVFAHMNELRAKLGERAVLRALHFYADNARVDREAKALENGDFESFKENIIESGFSSYMYNQNVFAASNPSVQPVSLALAVSEKLLRGKGAWRVHGGGFAGTIQAFVPNDFVQEYKTTMEGIFGEGSCYILSIRSIGGTEIKAD